MNMLEIRQERAGEHRETENVVREAFWNVYQPGCEEHYLAHIMRGCPEFVPELDLVAVKDGRIVGNVMNMRSIIDGDDGERHEVLTLGPIAVLPECQRTGVGKSLIAEVRRLAKGLGYRAIVLCGDPDYYMKFGFEPAEKYRIRNSANMFLDALMVCGLQDGDLSDLSGKYFEGSIYQLDHAAVQEFDRTFPPKAQISDTPSQKRFIEIASRVRPYAGK
jgi:predicted N-acetyltransferase YhbS